MLSKSIDSISKNLLGVHKSIYYSPDKTQKTYIQLFTAISQRKQFLKTVVTTKLKLIHLHCNKMILIAYLYILALANSYPQGSLECFSTLTRPDRRLICPESR